MSQPDCGACNNLREYAPEFVQNGVSSNIAASLKNNTGLNPSLTVTHTNCDDLNDVNDCLIGRMGQEVETTDVCEWKPFMRKLIPNIYETVKAVIASTCGLWTRVDALCSGIDTVLALIRGEAPRSHAGEWFSNYCAKIQITWPDGTVYTGDAIKSIQGPAFLADIIGGAGCDTNKKLGRWALSHEWLDKSYYPNSPRTQILTQLDVGEAIGIIRRSDVPVSDISESRWKDIIKSIPSWPWYIVGGDTIMYFRGAGYVVIDGVEVNPHLREYGENNLVIFVAAFVGTSRTGGCSSISTASVKTYNA